MNMRYPLLWMVLCSCLPYLIVAAEASKQKPLFPVVIEHDLPNPEATFNEVRELIVENYYYADIGDRDLYWAAINGMLRHISPPESPELARIWTAADYGKIANSLKGVKVSIGIKSSFNATDGSLTVTEVMEGSPAETLLVPLDRIMRIDGELLKGRGVQDIDGLLQGEAGTDVRLTVVRDVKSFEITITRDEFKTQNMKIAVLPPGDVVYVEIAKITAALSDELKSELARLQEDGVTKLILDLRNNTGGVFLDSLKIAELFLPAKSVLLRTLTRSDRPQNYVSSNDEPFDFRSVILVNAKTASSCEIIVGALQDNKKASVVGSKTYGKSVIEKTFTLENQYRVKFITSSMYTPLGRTWQSKGIVPDFAVEQDDATLAQLTRLSAAERLKRDVGLITGYKLVTR